MAINVKVSLDDPFALLSDEAIATTGSSTSSCAAIVTPDGNGSEGAALCTVICTEKPWATESTCVWTGNCNDECMFDDESEC